MKIPFDRVVTLILPYVSVVSGFVATWLITNVQLLGLFNVSQSSLEGLIATGIVFVITTGAAELGRSQWVKGRQIELTGLAQESILTTQSALVKGVPLAEVEDLSDESLIGVDTSGTPRQPSQDADVVTVSPAVVNERS